MSGGQRGSTLIECMIAMLLLGIVITGIVPAFLAFLDANTRNELRTGALQAARSELESLRRVPASTLPSTGSSGPETIWVGDRAFSVVTYYCREASFCDAVTRHISLEVRYDGDPIYGTETVYTELR